MIMIVMMTVMTGIPEAISKEKEIGTFDGMLSAGAVWALNGIIEWFEENRPNNNQN